MTKLIKYSSPNGFSGRSVFFNSPLPFIDEIMKGDLFPSFTSDLLEGDISGNMPSVNISETPDHYEVELSVPGISKEDIRVELNDGSLIITAENGSGKEEGNKRYSRREFTYGAFKKSFRLSEDVDAGKISASCENGVLKLVLPKREEAKPAPPRQIAIG